MRGALGVLVAAALLIGSLEGCATLRNTKVPEAFTELGYCTKCRKVMALDGLADATIVSCPNCDRRMTAGDAKRAFRKRIVDLKNQKVALGAATVAMMAASIAGAMYGIPIPPPPVGEETFTPYEMPMHVRCRQAVPVFSQPETTPAPYREPAEVS